MLETHGRKSSRLSPELRECEGAAPAAVCLIAGADRLHEIEDFWRQAQGHPNTDFEAFREVCILRQDRVRPHVAVLVKGGQIRGLLAARLERTAFSGRVAYVTAFSVKARVLRVLYQGVLGDVTVEDARSAVQHLWDVLACGEADIVEFHSLIEGSPLHEALAKAPRLWTEKRGRAVTHWSLELPQAEEAPSLRMSAKHRKALRRKEREIKEDFGEAVEWRWISSFDSIPEFCDRLEQLASVTYQRGLGVGFRNNEETQRRFQVFARRGQLRAQLLSINGVVRGFWLGIVYHNVFYSSVTGYDPGLRQYEPGNLMFHRMVESLVREGVTRLDFGLGDSFYKQRFGDRSWTEVTLRMFSPTAKGAALMICASLVRLADFIGRELLRHVRRTDWLKTRWRRLVSRNLAHS